VLGVTDGERQKLAELYAAGQALWRVSLEHFSPFDCNYPLGPTDAAPPGQPDPRTGGGDEVDDPRTGAGYGTIAFENQVLYEAVPVVGTPFALHYASDTAEGREADRKVEVSLSGASVPSSLISIELEIEVAGRRFTQTFPPLPDQQHVFTWDGIDVYGRRPQGRQPIDIRPRWIAESVYFQSGTSIANRSFGQPAAAPIPGSLVGREPLRLEQRWKERIGAFSKRDAGVGGLSLTVHHGYDPHSGVLYLGDGTRRSRITDVLLRVADEDDVLTPLAVAYAPDGSLLVADTGGTLLRRIDRDGIIRRVAGDGTFDATNQGDGAPATQAPLGRLAAVAAA
jgi:hypothetical protein